MFLFFWGGTQRKPKPFCGSPDFGFSSQVGAATLFLRFYEWYIASIALSTELLGEYTYRLNYQQTNIFVYRNLGSFFYLLGE